MIYTLKNEKLEVSVSDLGARLMSVELVGGPKVVDTPDPYAVDFDAYMGATVGRMCGRIAGEALPMDIEGRNFAPALNDGGKNHLHGGNIGFDRRTFAIVRQSAESVTLAYLSPDGEEGYPGQLDVRVTYSINGAALTIRFDCRAEGAATPVCMTNHAYFNLDGDFVCTDDHILSICSAQIDLLSQSLAPTGQPFDIEHTVLDFSAPRKLGTREALAGAKRLLAHVRGGAKVQIAAQQLALAGGYDFCYILGAHADNEPVAELYSPNSGVRMKVYTDQPCLQLYSGNFLSRGGYDKQSAVCLEAQGYVGRPLDNLVPDGGRYQKYVTYAFDIEQ